MTSEQKIEQLEKEVIELKKQLSALAGYVLQNAYCKCTTPFFSNDNICQMCKKPMMVSGVAQTGT
jgi:hypothetical protein